MFPGWADLGLLLKMPLSPAAFGGCAKPGACAVQASTAAGQAEHALSGWAAGTGSPSLMVAPW